MKRCTKCGELKHTDDFYKDKARPLGLRTRCKKCVNESRRGYSYDYQRTSAGRKVHCQSRIRRVDPDFTISDADWDTHWNATECLLCGKDLPIGTATHKHFDHKHGTNIYRGTLCSGCNTNLGVYEKMLTNPKLNDYLGGTQ